jgi:hydrogenase maturation protease
MHRSVCPPVAVHPMLRFGPTVGRGTRVAIRPPPVAVPLPPPLRLAWPDPALARVIRRFAVSRSAPAAGGAGPLVGRAGVLVLGVGNELFTDEGLGCAAARMVADLELPGVDVLDGATLGLALLPELADRTGLLLLDAVVRQGARPGELVVLHGDGVWGGSGLAVSAHQIGVAEALAAVELVSRAPARLAVVGMVPVSLDTGCGLSPAVVSRLPAMVDLAREILRGWGVRGA